MKKWEKIEDKLNLSLIQKYDSLRENLKSFISHAKAKIINKTIDLYNQVLPLINQLKIKAKQVSAVNPKEASEAIKNALKAITWKNFLSLLKAPPYKKIGSFIKRNSLNISFSIIIAFGSYNLIQEIQHIFPEKKTGREIASVSKLNKRPSYYLLKNRHLKIENVKIPVSLNQNKRISSIIADVIIECPNRTTQQFLYNAPHLVQDKLNNTIAPQINSFPLTEEGKVILRKKIGLELSELLKENQFKQYKIQKVNIIQVTSS